MVKTDVDHCYSVHLNPVCLSFSVQLYMLLIHKSLIENICPLSLSIHTCHLSLFSYFEWELKVLICVAPPAQLENYPPLGEIQSLHALLGFSQWVSIRGKYPKVKSVTSVTLQSQNNITALTLCLFRCVVQETASFSD